MRVAIISDIHDNVPNLEKFLQWAKEDKIEELIVCGDLTAPATLAKVLAPGFQGKIHLVYGNVADRELEMKKAKEFANVVHYGDQGKFEIGGKQAGLVHYPNKARDIAVSSEHDIVFYGHTHTPWIEEVGRTYLVNPGTLAGLFNKATFAFWDTQSNKLELKILYELF